MKDEYSHLDPSEALKVENEVIKMKLMLEHGAEFRYEAGAAPISPETEHEFLNYIMDFEKQEALAMERTVFEVLGSPRHFPEVDEVGEDRIREVLEELMAFMVKRGIELSVLSPNVGYREIYRFITRELFAHRMLHINMPGMVTCFIYDEFHPDHPYENSRMAVNECMKDIFSTHELQWTFQYEPLMDLNGREGLPLDDFRKAVNGFKKRYGSIEPLVIDVEDCEIHGDACVVSGRFEICFTNLGEHMLKTGIWSVRLRYRADMGLWMICGVQAEGIQFAD